MRTVLITLLIFLLLSCKSQFNNNFKKNEKIVDYRIDTTTYNRFIFQPERSKVSNQGEKMMLDIKDYFETNKLDIQFIPCDSTKYKHINNKERIITGDEIIYKLENKELFSVRKGAIGLQTLIELGLLNDLLYCKVTKKAYLNFLSELRYMDIPDDTRRYMFLKGSEQELAPLIVGLIELKNPNATKKTKFEDFIKDAKVIKIGTPFLF